MADCQVAEVLRLSDGTGLTTMLPKCALGGANAPCWRLEAKPQCAGSSPDGLGVTVDYGAAPPGDQRARIEVDCRAR